MARTDGKFIVFFGLFLLLLVFVDGARACSCSGCCIWTGFPAGCVDSESLKGDCCECEDCEWGSWARNCNTEQCYGCSGPDTCNCVSRCESDECCDDGTCMDRCTPSVLPCNYDPYWIGSDPVSCLVFHPIDKSCPPEKDGKVCGYELVVLREKSAACFADCDPYCTRNLVRCAEWHWTYCKNVYLPPFSLYCTCAGTGSPITAGNGWECP